MNIRKHKRYLTRLSNRKNKNINEYLIIFHKDEKKIKNIKYSFQKLRNKGKQGKLKKELRQYKNNEIDNINALLGKAKG